MKIGQQVLEEKIFFQPVKLTRGPTTVNHNNVVVMYAIITKTHILTKFQHTQIKNTSSRVSSIWPSNLVFLQDMTHIELGLDIVKTNILIKNHAPKAKDTLLTRCFSNLAK